VLPRVDDIGRYAVFLDLDGTLLELEDHFDRVRAEHSTLLLLERLSEKTGRALAIISGRDIAAIDRILHPLIFPVGAVRGLQRRDAKGVVHAEGSFDIAPIAFVLRTTIGHETGILIEPKPGAVAVHYRLRSDLESRCREIVEDIVAQRPDLSIYAGKMVFEIAYDRSDKGNTIDTFLNERPFLGRIPIFAGDDPTDECGFFLVNAKGGISIKVGSEPTVAKYQVDSVQELREWLIELAGEPRLEAAQ
jgi:trehalose 6-phosphate phosphatase